MIELNGNQLSLNQFKSIVQKRESVELSKAARERLSKSRQVVEQALKTKESVYGINTGFGALARVVVPPEKLGELQLNFVRSHCCGVGTILTEEESRALLLLRIQALAKGYSGVTQGLLDLLIQMLNLGVHPVIPSQGSVGASGDLAPLAHMAAVVVGEGEAHWKGRRVAGGEALKQAGLKPVVLQPKEALALVNGTQLMTGIAALTLLKAEELSDLADLICVSSLDGTLGTPRAYKAWAHEARPLTGQKKSAALMWSLAAESEIAESHKECKKVQDPYSFRCAPQVHGAARDLFGFVRKTLEIEMNSATDNPLVNPDTGEILSQGNFHGQPIAFALDILAMGLSELASISERRIAKLVDPAFSELPAFLTKEQGLCSGFMVAQYTAAALVSESKLLTHPASTDSIPTSNEQEDHVSMGPIGAKKVKQILENTSRVLAIEALCACQALDFRKPLKPGRGAAFLQSQVRKEIPTLEKDRYLHLDIEKVGDWIREGSLHAAAKSAGLL